MQQALDRVPLGVGPADLEQLLDLGLDLQYRPWRRFGVGAGMRYFNITVDDNRDSDSLGRFVYEYFGPVIYGVYSF